MDWSSFSRQNLSWLHTAGTSGYFGRCNARLANSHYFYPTLGQPRLFHYCLSLLHGKSNKMKLSPTMTPICSSGSITHGLPGQFLLTSSKHFSTTFVLHYMRVPTPWNAQMYIDPCRHKQGIEKFQLRADLCGQEFHCLQWEEVWKRISISLHGKVFGTAPWYHQFRTTKEGNWSSRTTYQVARDGVCRDYHRVVLLGGRRSLLHLTIPESVTRPLDPATLLKLVLSHSYSNHGLKDFCNLYDEYFPQLSLSVSILFIVQRRLSSFWKCWRRLVFGCLSWAMRWK